ncbi:MAG: hypothetical protein LBQ98_00110 [Nitrososphaerota archaeon]|jgi:hypothetical protein|nr:hypothetical protein [Nitrososphaerota archaeon]
MSTIANNAVNEEDKRYIFERCIALTDIDEGKDYGADYEHELLRIATKFITPDNRLELEKTLSKLESQKWGAEKFKLLHLDIIDMPDGKEAAIILLLKMCNLPKSGK